MSLALSSFEIKNFSVTGLHGDTSISVPILENRLVLVGVNGLGKSTFINMFYLFITRQWRKLAEYDFESVSMILSDRYIALNKIDIVNFVGFRRDLLRMFPSRFRSSTFDKIIQIPDIVGLYDKSFSEQVEILRTYGLTRPEAEYFHHFVQREEKIGENTIAVRETDKYISNTIKDKVLYLPTYRRIEKDLNIVFPGVEDEIKRHNDARRKQRAANPNSYIEFVEFGMEDVEDIVKSTLSKLKDTARAELNNLAGGYLRDVIRGEGRTFNKDFISNLTSIELDNVLDRVEENTLTDSDKGQLREVIERIKNDATVSSEDEYIAHFLTKLLKVGQTLRTNEERITDFINVCNKYLQGKVLRYNEVSYELSIERKDGKPIELKSLSSGEKQIVSLFAQLYLGVTGSYVIIIDEPELSLSVEWQKSLLPDIQRSKHCSFIAAVTHSPFIFDNEFDGYTANMLDYVRVG